MSEKNQADIGENLIHIHVDRGSGAALKRVRGENRRKIEPAESAAPRVVVDEPESRDRDNQS
jgi:hypothetical protein